MQIALAERRLELLGYRVGRTAAGFEVRTATGGTLATAATAAELCALAERAHLTGWVVERPLAGGTTQE
ncbi:MAG TPA: hypothetical protein VFS21_14310 [Roseiflexaceae bacterium]|nr:hypothetical protein [Roseiflexaceae bacterium]